MQLLMLARKGMIGVLALAVTYAVFVGVFRLELPGLYYDELLYLPASFAALGKCGSYAAVSTHLGNCFPILLSPFYLGALKAYVYAPLVAVFPVSAELVRLPTAMLAVVLGLVSYPFFRNRLGPVGGALAAVLLLTSPVYLWHARIDWGPFIIGATFRFLVVAFAIRWLETGRPLQLFLAGAMFVLGMYDKLNFVWMLPPLAVALLAVYPAEIVAAARRHPRATAAITLLYAAIGLAFLFYNIIPALQMQIYPRGQTLLGNAWRVIALLRHSFSGAAQASWMFNSPVQIDAFLAYVLLAQFVLGTLVAAVVVMCRRRLWNEPVLWGRVKLFVALHIIATGCAVMLMLSADATGSHHAVFLLPFTAFQAAALLVVIANLTRLLVPRAAAATACILAILAGVVVIDQIRIGATYLSLLKADSAAYRPVFSPEIYQLSRDLEGLGSALNISVDWGMHMQLASLAVHGHQNNYRDYWPVFNDASSGELASKAILSFVPAGASAVFVSRPPEASTMRKAVENFRTGIASLPGCVNVSPQDVKASAKAYLVFMVRNNCT